MELVNKTGWQPADSERVDPEEEVVPAPERAEARRPQQRAVVHVEGRPAPAGLGWRGRPARFRP